MKNHCSCGHHYQKIKFGYYFKFRKYESGPWRWLCGENACCMNILRIWQLVGRRTTCHPVHRKQRHRSLVKASYSSYQKGWALGLGRDSDHMGGCDQEHILWHPEASTCVHIYSYTCTHTHPHICKHIFISIYANSWIHILT